MRKNGRWCKNSSAGGGGATSDVDGTNGGDTYYEFNYNGSQIQIVSEAGAGGSSGDNGGAGGVGGQCRIVSGGAGATNVTTTGQYTVNGLPINISVYYAGNDGTDGGPTLGGTGGPTALVGGFGGGLLPQQQVSGACYICPVGINCCGVVPFGLARVWEFRMRF